MDTYFCCFLNPFPSCPLDAMPVMLLHFDSNHENARVDVSELLGAVFSLMHIPPHCCCAKLCMSQ